MKLKNKQNPAVRNYGFGSRDPKKAVLNACKSFYESHVSAHEMAQRFIRFIEWLELSDDRVTDLRDINQAHVDRYVKSLEARVDNMTMAVSTAHHYVSAINRVLYILTGNKECWISVRYQTDIPNRAYVSTTRVSMHSLPSLRESMNPVDIMIHLQYWIGLRFEESAKINARQVHLEAISRNVVSITDGTKGGRRRVIPITEADQLTVLKVAAEVQSGHRSLIPASKTYAEFRRESYAQYRHVPFHSYRHQYAYRRYRALVGADCPVIEGVSHGIAHIRFLAKKLDIAEGEAKARDLSARTIVAQELGHGRIDITNNYLG